MDGINKCTKVAEKPSESSQKNRIFSPDISPINPQESYETCRGVVKCLEKIVKKGETATNQALSQARVESRIFKSLGYRWVDFKGHDIAQILKRQKEKNIKKVEVKTNRVLSPAKSEPPRWFGIVRNHVVNMTQQGIAHTQQGIAHIPGSVDPSKAIRVCTDMVNCLKEMLELQSVQKSLEVIRHQLISANLQAGFDGSLPLINTGSNGESSEDICEDRLLTCGFGDLSKHLCHDGGRGWARNDPKNQVCFLHIYYHSTI